MKSNFKLLERVVLVNLPINCELHGKSGFIAGKAATHAEFDSYIVWLDIPTDTHLAVVLGEQCIDPEPQPIIGESASYL